MVPEDRFPLPEVEELPHEDIAVKAETHESLSKVPEVTLLFWIIKIAATTLGETGGDAVTMSMHLGYLVGSGIFATIFAAMVIAQISAKQFRPWLYWTTIVATTTVGTTLADFADRSLGIDYTGGTSLLFTLLLGSLFVLLCAGVEQFAARLAATR